jgi:alpha-D-ribose 1-methylphosphonate 5-triphosphate diphosphatase
MDASSWRLTGGTALLEDGLRREEIMLEGGAISSRATMPQGGGFAFDATGLWVLPGIVDIHGDAHERQLQPRPGVELPTGLALRDSAAQLAAAGITTAYLGVTLSWEPGLRSIAAWRDLLGVLEQERPRAATDLRVHLRFEADNFDALDDALGAIEGGKVDLLAFNDHTPAILRRLDEPKQLAKYAGRAGMAPAEYAALARRIGERRPEVPAVRARMAAAAHAAGLPMLSHDDASIEERSYFRGLGASICEFPMAEEVAAFAREAGEAVVMGSPNVVRGGSHLGWASAAPLAERGLVTVLASDYAWPAMLQAAFTLAGRGELGFAPCWALVSANPAAALGLADRGRIAPGLRGDVVVVDPAVPRVVASFCGGRLAWISPEGAGRLRSC